MEIQKHLNLRSYEPIRNVLLFNNVDIRSKSQAKYIRDRKFKNVNGRTYTLNHHYFKEINNESAYWLGFIYADGNIFNSKLTIGLQESDVCLLNKFKECIESDKVIYYNDKLKSKILSIDSVILTDDLREIGLHEDKSGTIKFPKIPEDLMVDFIRGVFDGDGSVGIQYPSNSRGIKTELAQIRVRIFGGSYDFMKSLEKKMRTTFNLNPKRVRMANKSTYVICYSTNESIKIYDKLYYEGCMRLERKYEDFTRYIQQRNDDISNKRKRVT